MLPKTNHLLGVLYSCLIAHADSVDDFGEVTQVELVVLLSRGCSELGLDLGVHFQGGVYQFCFHLFDVVILEVVSQESS